MKESDWEALQALEDNWDTYNAPAPTAQSIEAAKGFFEQSYGDPRVAASAEGGIAVSYANAKAGWMVEFYNDGSVATLWHEVARGGKMKASDGIDWSLIRRVKHAS